MRSKTKHETKLQVWLLTWKYNKARCITFGILQLPDSQTHLATWKYNISTISMISEIYKNMVIWPTERERKKKQISSSMRLGH